MAKPLLNNTVAEGISRRLRHMTACLRKLPCKWCETRVNCAGI